MEKAAIKLRTFIDKITTAPRGYSGLFDAVKINEKELTANGDVFIHMYRKSETRPHRKLGHATVIAETLEELLPKAEALRSQLQIIAD
jgi:5-(carboxyamino)imidazole ribonucleotide synthase